MQDLVKHSSEAAGLVGNTLRFLRFDNPVAVNRRERRCVLMLRLGKVRRSRFRNLDRLTFKESKAFGGFVAISNLQRGYGAAHINIDGLRR
jgi:hypothetical protein